jgi:glutamate formiminotransferase / 5-formyltetrahydrofolate cyclo-ligase
VSTRLMRVAAWAGPASGAGARIVGGSPGLGPLLYSPAIVPTLECVPNLSEGRQPEVVARLASAAAGPGVQLLDVSSDPDHNRSVFTLAGEPEALIAGLLALYQAAIAELDLRRHRGVHPRIGAVDVVPFVPLGGTPMEVAVAAARRLAPEVARRFGLPVYLYEEAAARPDRRSLARIRRGGFEGLADKLADPAWAPDYGPPRPHQSAGATVIGARFFLIAWNAILDTADVAVARAVAGAVRESGGGLPAVRALGFYLASRGRAQVSMNLVDYRRTSLSQALDLVRREAAARGTRVVASELVGLLPQQAALDVVRETLQLPAFGAEQLLEERLRATPPAALAASSVPAAPAAPAG